jgi:hypothetical protein
LKRNAEVKVVKMNAVGRSLIVGAKIAGSAPLPKRASNCGQCNIPSKINAVIGMISRKL